MLELQIFFFFLDRPSHALAPSPEAAYTLFKETCGVEMAGKRQNERGRWIERDPV